MSDLNVAAVKIIAYWPNDRRIGENGRFWRVFVDQKQMYVI